MEDPVRLTSRASCAGCASKMGPQALHELLVPLRGIFDPSQHADLLSGLEMPDDAAVWRLDSKRAIVLTADFFPPVVDEPYHYGAIAAANALSDLYAMGADPLFALNLVAFPDDLERSILAEILRGGALKVREAGAVIAGGHTIVDQEPKYGLAAVGIVDPSRILTKAGARSGDVVLLTKPIGAGVATTAAKRGKADSAEYAAAIDSMERLSRNASGILREFGAAVHALTDVTGFSLAGNAHEIAHQSGLTLRIAWNEVPLLPGAERYARAGFLSGGLRRNESYYGAWTRYAHEPPEPMRHLLFDPQTSGGLLAVVARDAQDAILAAFEARSEPVWRIGEAIAGNAGGIEVV